MFMRLAQTVLELKTGAQGDVYAIGSDCTRTENRGSRRCLCVWLRLYSN